MVLPLKDVVKFSRCGVFSVFFSVEIDFDGGGKKCLLPEAEAPACLLFVPPSRVDKNVRYKQQKAVERKVLSRSRLVA